MRITHIAIWTKRLEDMKNFYIKYFNGQSNEKYTNQIKGFESYFIKFEGETTLEIMRSIHINDKNVFKEKELGLCHFAFQLESRNKVDLLTEQLEKDGYQIIGKPRITGDGFYESVILDIDGNHIELVSK